MDIRQWIIRQAAKLRKDFPEQGGVFAVVRSESPYTSLHEGFDGDPNADNRPQFIKDDEVGWQRIGTFRDK